MPIFVRIMQIISESLKMLVERKFKIQNLGFRFIVLQIENNMRTLTNFAWGLALASAIFCSGVSTVSAQSGVDSAAEKIQRRIERTLQAAGVNRVELEKAIKAVGGENRRGMRFLLAYMPVQDAKNLNAEFLIEHVNGAYGAWKNSPWKDQVSEEMFLNYILPYSSVSEKREAWRSDFNNRFLPLVKDAKTASEAAVILNQKIFPLLKVKYSTRRKRADQGPYESIESGLASCTGLSVLLIDACRAVGIPARFVGIPKWTDGSGNHSWVEIWDQEWKYTGAAEPTGDQLNRGWFSNRAAFAKVDDPAHSIYAVSFKDTGLRFPMVWARNSPNVWATNVTQRYVRDKIELKPDQVLWRIRAVDGSGERVAINIRVKDGDDAVVFAGTTKNESFDTNDHVERILKKNHRYSIAYGHQNPDDEKPAQASARRQASRIKFFKTTDRSPAEPWTIVLKDRK